jgi:hypothetical protein
MQKIYLVFAGSKFYPKGGWKDFVWITNSIEEALENLANYKGDRDWWQIVDKDEMVIVKEGKE